MEKRKFSYFSNVGYRNVFCVFIFICILLYLYGESFSFYFFGDDYYFIDFVLKEKAHILYTSPVGTHYCPLGLSLSAIPAFFGSLNPWSYGIINFLFYLLCSLLVMVVLYNLAHDSWIAFLGALLYATAVPNSEVIYWKTGILTICMTIFSLIAFFFFIRHLETGSKRSLFLSAAAFAASMLSIEQGVAIYPVLLLYDLLFSSGPEFLKKRASRRTVLFQFLRRFSILSLVPIAHTAVKLGLGLSLTPADLADRSTSRLSMLAISSITHLVDFNDILFRLAGSTLAFRILSACILVGFFAYSLIRRRKLQIFFLVSAFGSMLLITLSANGLNPRYFSLPLVFFCSFLASFVSDMAAGLTAFAVNRLHEERGISREQGGNRSFIPKAAAAIICSALVIAGMRGFVERRSYYKVVSEMERNIVKSAIEAYATNPGGLLPGRKIYLLNIPDWFWCGKYPYTRFIVTGRSALPDIAHRIGGEDRVEAVASTRFFHIQINGQEMIYVARGRTFDSGTEKIEKLVREGNLFLIFSPRNRDILPFHPGN